MTSTLRESLHRVGKWARLAVGLLFLAPQVHAIDPRTQEEIDFWYRNRPPGAFACKNTDRSRPVLSGSREYCYCIRDPNTGKAPYVCKEFYVGGDVSSEQESQSRGRADSPRPTSPEVDACDRLPGSRLIEVDAPVRNAVNPSPNFRLTLGQLNGLYRNLYQKDPPGQIMGLTLHVQSDGVPDQLPFSLDRISVDVKPYKSKLGRNLCIAVQKIRLEYNPLSVLIARELAACTKGLMRHEMQHYTYVDAIDTHFSGNMLKVFNSLGLPSYDAPLMVDTANEAAVKVREIKGHVKQALIDMYNSAARSAYGSLYDAHRAGTDSVRRYEIEHREQCLECSEKWPRKLCPAR